MTEMQHASNTQGTSNRPEQLPQEDTFGTKTLIEGILDIESLPIEIEGLNFLLDEVEASEKNIIEFLEPLPYMNNPGTSQFQAPSLDPEHTILNPITINVPKTPQNDFLQTGPSTTSTPVSSTFINNLQDQDENLATQNMSVLSQISEISIPTTGEIRILEIDKLLKLPEQKKA